MYHYRHNGRPPVAPIMLQRIAPICFLSGCAILKGLYNVCKNYKTIVTNFLLLCKVFILNSAGWNAHAGRFFF